MADNPFNALLNPDKQGTITGFLGGVMGNPTASQAAGGATGDALKELSTLRAQGQNPQQALITFLQSPSGQDYFVNAGPDGLKQLTDGLQATVPPAPVLTNAPAGSSTYATDPSTGKVTLQGQQPTTEVQNFSTFSQIAKLPAAKIKELAELHADPTAKNKESDAKVAVDNLIKNYNLDPATGAGILAGTIKVLPIKDQYNADTGRVSVVDITRNTINEISPGKSNITPPGAPAATSPEAPAAGAPVGATPASGAATGIIPAAKSEPGAVQGPGTFDPTENPKYFGNKSSMFLGAGIVPNVLGAASKLGEQISPELILPEGAVANDRQTLIAHTRNALLSLSDNGGFGINKSVINTFKDLLPSDSASSSPHDAIQKGIRLLQGIQSEAAAEDANTTRSDLPQSERVAAAKRAEGWRRVERTLPTMEEMSKMEQSIRNGTAGAQNVEQGVRSLIDQGKKVFSSGKKQADGVQSSVANELSVEKSFDNMQPAELLKIDPRTLNVQQIIALRNRIQTLRSGAKK